MQPLWILWFMCRFDYLEPYSLEKPLLYLENNPFLVIWVIFGDFRLGRHSMSTDRIFMSKAPPESLCSIVSLLGKICDGVWHDMRVGAGQARSIGLMENHQKCPKFTCKSLYQWGGTKWCHAGPGFRVRNGQGLDFARLSNHDYSTSEKKSHIAIDAKIQQQSEFHNEISSIPL